MTAYINPFTDFGFKKLFGEEASKPLLKAFLNDLLPLDDKIIELDFTTPEQLPRSASERRAIYDLFCIDEKGHRFIVELQKNRQNYFKDRTVYYATFPIQKQAQAGLWDFQLTPVYCVGLLNFVFNEDRDIPDYFHTIKLKDQHCEIFYDKLTFFYIEFPKFIKTEAQLASHFDKFLYFIKHLDEFESMPEIFKGDIIEQGFERARLAQLNEIQRDAYEQSLKELRDAYNVVQTAIVG
ncbi:MAG: Rpn family recombination-promoting nuclease/putative transposase, partial [Methylococcales bacterium]